MCPSSLRTLYRRHLTAQMSRHSGAAIVREHPLFSLWRLVTLALTLSRLLGGEARHVGVTHGSFC